MTVYNSVKTIPGNLLHMCGDAVGNLYVVSTGATAANYTVYLYDISSNTLTDISDMTFPANPGCGFGTQLEWFSGTVYALIPVDATNMGVYAWLGATTWALVDSAAVPPGTFANSRNYIVADSTRIAWCLWDPVSGFVAFRASTNGTVWADQTSPYSSVVKLHFDYDTDQLIGEDNNGANMCTVAHSAGNNWGSLGAVASKYHLIGTVHDYQFYADDTLPTATELRRSQDYCVTQAADGAALDRLTENMQIFYLLNTGVMIWPTSTNTGRVYIWDEPTLAWVLDGVVGAAAAIVVGDPIRDTDTMYMLRTDGATAGIYARGATFPPIVVVKKAYKPDIHYPLSLAVDADDAYLYVSCIYSSFPVLLKLLSDLTTAPTEAYAPGAGTTIGVRAGIISSEWVWVAGDFGASLIQLSIDSGATWTNKTGAGWAGVALPFLLGENDDHVILILGSNAYETINGGLNWTQLSSTLAIDVRSFDMLDVHLDEGILGADTTEAGIERVHHTVNRLRTTGDVTGTVPADVVVTSVLVG